MDMLYITWSERNNLGIPIIDEQHRGIVSTINSLYHCMRKGKGMIALSPVMTMMKQYIDIHFRVEESLLKEAGYPALDEHLDLHKTLERETGKIERESTLSEDPERALKFLKDWWLTHINIEDRKYVPYVLNTSNNG